MKLPKRDLPQYEIHLPASDIKVKYRPYTIKEDQILSMAEQSSSEQDKLNAIFQIVENCLDYDINKIYPAEVEYLFMKIKASSDVSKIPIEYTVTEEYDDDGELVNEDEVGDVIKSMFNLDTDIQIEYDKDKIAQYAEKQEDGGWLVKLTGHIYAKVFIKPMVEVTEDIIYDLIDYIIDESQPEDDKISQKGVDYERDEFLDWLNSQSIRNFDNFTKFVNSLPKCVAHIKFKTKSGRVIEEKEAGILRFLV